MNGEALQNGFCLLRVAALVDRRGVLRTNLSLERSRLCSEAADIDDVDGHSVGHLKEVFTFEDG